MTRTIRTNTWFPLATFVYAACAACALLAMGCEQGAEGDRCNPDLVDTTECNGGLSCVTPSSCVISVCCPPQGPYTDPNCECFSNPQGAACLGSCNVDAAYDGMPISAPAPSSDAGVLDAAKDATHE